jgi:hypothetical protein
MCEASNEDREFYGVRDCIALASRTLPLQDGLEP